MYHCEVNDVNQLLYEACNAVMSQGKRVTVRGQETMELHPAHFTIANPRKRTLLYPYRGNNPFATLFETVWVLGAKDNDITHLSKYLPRAKDYSDDGRRWRARYPERIRKYGKNNIDQFKYVYEKLKADPESRQVVINLSNPDIDTFNEDGTLLESKDFNCSQNLTFVIRDDKLDCTFYVRSNDACYGMSGINFYEFSVMQEILAGLLNVEVGSFYYYTNSLHIYAKHYDKAKKITDEGKRYADFLVGDDSEEHANTVTTWHLPVFKFFIEGMDTYEDQMNMYEGLYYELTQCPGVADGFRPERIEDIYRLLTIYQKYKDRGFLGVEGYAAYRRDMDMVNVSDLKASCEFWMMKHIGYIESYNISAAMYCVTKIER